MEGCMKFNLLLQIPAVGLLLTLLYVTPALAQWSTNPNTNNAICTATGNQQSPIIVSDGSGGAIITWYDYRSGNSDIYAQRVNASGLVQWTTNGAAICTVPSDQYTPTIVSDGSGGAIITWTDFRLGNADVYAQRVDASGDPLWFGEGVPICTETHQQQNLNIVSDGSHGAIITWMDPRGSYPHIYAQRVDSSGVPRWTTNGIAIDTATGGQYSPIIVSDGSGGAIITWSDLRSGNSDIYAQRVDASGAPQWMTDGVPVCTEAHNQQDLTIVSDGSGGAIIAWEDQRSGNYDIYAQGVSASGTRLWTTDGVSICTASGDQTYPTLVSDGSGGAIITWQDHRGSTNDIYAQRMNASGTVQWTSDGVAIDTATGNQLNPIIVSDGSGGAIITWQDHRGSDYDIYAQRVNASSATQWTAGGVPVCTAVHDQLIPTIVSDGSGGAIITWLDTRSSDYDIYAQKVDVYGYLGNMAPQIAKVKDVINDQGGKVTVSWSPSCLDVYPNTTIKSYYIFRGVNEVMGMKNIKAPGDFLKEISSGKDPGSLLLKTPRSAQGVDSYYWEYIDSVRALRLPGYSYTMPTVSDSGPQGTAMCYVMVMARTSDELTYWFSTADSGYSVDNLPPITPQNAALLPMVNGSINIHWNPDKTDPDVGHFSVYRSTSSGFPLNNGTRLQTTVDTTVTDSSAEVGQQYYYRVTAVDIHGNESQPTAELHTAALSVQLASMTATTLATGVQIEWTTVSETNSLGFYVERRVQNTGAYATVSNLIPGAGTTLQQHHYQWTDTKVTDGNYNYRLRLVDLSGTCTYSNAIAVTVSGVTGVNGSLPTEFALEQNYPNPFNPTTVISYQLPVASYVTLKVYDMLGQEVATLVNGARDAGYKSVQFSATNLPSGIYTYRLTARPTDGGQAGTYVEVKKMLLLK